MSSIQGELERLLKESPYFADVMNTHRAATAQIVGAFIQSLIDAKKLTAGDALALLKSLDVPTGHPSLDSSRRYLISVIREGMK